jgi:predicted transcriptional regulator
MEPTLKEAIVRSLGELEERVMHVLWRRQNPSTVREVFEQVTTDRDLAYTTVMTVMDRLWRKGLLRRESRGRAFEYTPGVSEAEYTAGLMHGLLTTSRDRRQVLAHFLSGMRKADEAELIRLAREAKSRKRPR